MSTGAPFGQLPILIYHDVTLCQSMAIARFLAKKTGIYGETEVEQAYADLIADAVVDFNDSKIGKKNSAFFFKL